jgi:hypothetical protein
MICVRLMCNWFGSSWFALTARTLINFISLDDNITNSGVQWSSSSMVVKESSDRIADWAGEAYSELWTE